METSFEEISRKYRSAKTGEAEVDLLRLKSEIESYMKKGSTKRRSDDSLVEAQDMLIDVTQMIEEDHCNPFRCK